MNERAILKKSLDYWQLWKERSLSELRERNLSEIRFINRFALALIGVRRCGKTFCALQKAKGDEKQTLYMNFEDPIFHTIKGLGCLDEIISVYTEFNGALPHCVIYDEIQNIDGWEKWARKEIDLNRFKLIITGSSAKMLSSELSTALSGRNTEYTIWPLSFKEFLEFENQKYEGADEYLAALRKYFTWGGFPDVCSQRHDVDKEKILKQYLSDAVLKDVIQRHEVRQVASLNTIATYYLTNISSLHTHHSVGNAFRINIETVTNYTSFLNEAFLIFELEVFSRNLKIKSRDPKKIYAIDSGLRNVNTTSLSDDIGKVAENVVYLELRRRGCQLNYFKNKTGEVDFVVVKSNKPVKLIQVCYSDLTDKKTFDREVGSLQSAMAELKLKNGFILTMNRTENLTVDAGVIQFLPLYVWLLDLSLALLVKN